VLVVEDDRTLATLLASNLRRLGLRADIALNAQQALALFAQNLYHLVLMDIGLPDRDGLEVCSEIRAVQGGNNRVPIVAITAGYSSPEECLKASMDGYYTKPVLLRQLEDLLKKWNIPPCPTDSDGVRA
jgi:CheY-like chemotaxis protein